jgi:hypothetical protein
VSAAAAVANHADDYAGHNAVVVAVADDAVVVAKEFGVVSTDISWTTWLVDYPIVCNAVVAWTSAHYHLHSPRIQNSEASCFANY